MFSPCASIVGYILMINWFGLDIPTVSKGQCGRVAVTSFPLLGMAIATIAMPADRGANRVPLEVPRGSV